MYSMNLTFIFQWIPAMCLIKCLILQKSLSWIFRRIKCSQRLTVASLHLYANVIWDKHAKKISGSNFLHRIELMLNR